MNKKRKQPKWYYENLLISVNTLFLSKEQIKEREKTLKKRKMWVD